MKIAGYVILVLAVVHLAYAVTTGVTQSLSASAWEIFLHLVLHPIAAIALVVMLLKPSTLDRGMTRNVIGLLLAASIAGDVHVFLEVGGDSFGGQSMLALLYALVPSSRAGIWRGRANRPIRRSEEQWRMSLVRFRVGAVGLALAAVLALLALASGDAEAIIGTKDFAGERLRHFPDSQP